MRSVAFCCLIVIVTLLSSAGPAIAEPGPVDPLSREQLIDFVTGAQVDEAAVRVTLHVDQNHPHADDGNDGTADKPFKTFGHGLLAAGLKCRAGTPVKLLVHPGVYREGGIVFNGRQWGGDAYETPLVIEGADDTAGAVTISGSDVYPFERWRPVHDDEGQLVYYQTEWPYEFGNQPGPFGKANSPRTIGHRREMMFIDGQPLRQVMIEEYDYKPVERGFQGSGTHTFRGTRDPAEVIEPGTFGVEERPGSAKRIVFLPPPGVDPAEALIEVAVRKQILLIEDKLNLVMRNLTFQHAAPPLQPRYEDFAVRLLGGERLERHKTRNVLIENCDFLWNNARGLGMHWIRDVTIRNTRVNYNGVQGANVSGVYNMIWEDNETSFNNWRGHMARNHDWDRGGVKFTFVHRSIFRNHHAIANAGRGFWFDIDNRNILIQDLTAVQNVRGLFLEISRGPFWVEDSLMAMDFEKSVFLLDADDVVLERCIVYGAPEAALVRNYYKRQIGRDEMARIFDLPSPAIVFESPGQLNITDSFIGNEQGLVISVQGAPLWCKRMNEKLYRGIGNVFYSTDQAAFKVSSDEPPVDLSAWTEQTREHFKAEWLNPQFDTANFSFVSPEGSPLRSARPDLPYQSLSEEDIAAMHRFQRLFNIGPDTIGRRYN